MGRSYSLNGYLNAVLRRSSSTRTLLVEGPTDKCVVHRLAAEQPAAPDATHLIDHAAMIKDDGLTGLGAKAKVVRVRAVANEWAEHFPKLSSKLACLTDREWDGIELNSPETLGDKWSLPAQAENHFITIGHSIENYHFKPDCIVDYLKFAFAEHLTQQLADSIARTFSGVVALAGAVSFAVQEVGCITRIQGLIRADHIRTDGSRFYLSQPFADAAAVREIAASDELLRKINAAVDSDWAQLSTSPHAHWLLHGHVGGEVIWACIAAQARESGCEGDVVDGIARGNQAERRRFWADWLATHHDEDSRRPLDQVAMWLQSSPQGATEAAEIPAAL